MVVSDKQQTANQRNAQHSTGPKTPEGKAAVRFNALTWGLRARSLMLPTDNPADYQQLWDALDAEWQPQTHTERHYLEQMCVTQWSLIHTAQSENRIRQAGLQLGRELELLDRVARQRVQLERSFTTTMHELERLQLKREARHKQPQPQPAQPVPSPQPPAPSPGQPGSPPPQLPNYVMSERAADHPLACAPAPDTR
jgi:hypothetical protein